MPGPASIGAWIVWVRPDPDHPLDATRVGNLAGDHEDLLRDASKLRLRA